MGVGEDDGKFSVLRTTVTNRSSAVGFRSFFLLGYRACLAFLHPVQRTMVPKLCRNEMKSEDPGSSALA